MGLETAGAEMDGGVGERARCNDVARGRGGRSGFELLLLVVVIEGAAPSVCGSDGADSSGSVILMVARDDEGIVSGSVSSSSTSTSSASRYHFLRLVHRPQPS